MLGSCSQIEACCRALACERQNLEPKLKLTQGKALFYGLFETTPLDRSVQLVAAEPSLKSVVR